MVLGQGLRLALTGAALGLAGALVGARALNAVLYEVSPSDPLTLASVSVLLIGIAAVACYLPARRAMAVDPIEALRVE